MRFLSLKQKSPELFNTFRRHLILDLDDIILDILSGTIDDVEFCFDHNKEESFSNREFVFGSETRKKLDFLVELLHVLWENGSLLE